MALDWSTILMWVLYVGGGLAAIGAVAFVLKKKKVLDVSRNTFLAVGIILLLVGGVGTSGILSGLGTQSLLPGTSGGLGANEQAIETFTASLQETGSNSYTAVTGRLRIYESDVDPTDPNANPVTNFAVTSGVVSDTGGVISTDHDYYVIFDDNQSTETHYAIDFGVISFPFSDYNENTATFLWKPGVTVDKMGNFSDMIVESNAETTLDINGQSNLSGTSQEMLVGTGAQTPTDGMVIVYNESVGDGSFYLDVTIGCEGGNEYCNGAVLDTLFESGAEPEGNEYSAITTQLLSGQNLNLPGDIVNYWKNEDSIALGDMVGGQTSDYRFTFTVTEANVDTNDDWKMLTDDLGDYRGKDISLSTGITYRQLDLDNIA